MGFFSPEKSKSIYQAQREKHSPILFIFFSPPEVDWSGWWWIILERVLLSMDDPERVLLTNGFANRSDSLDIYPLGCYYFGSRDPKPYRNESASDRLLRMKSNYAAYGMRNCVAAVLLVELFKRPHILLLQSRNSIYNLPGGRLRPGESDIDCLKRKLSSKLSAPDDNRGWEVGERVGIWWRPDFDSLLYPHLPLNVINPKECIKVYLIKLPVSRKFIVPKNFRLLAIPLSQLRHDETYGQIICGVPRLLSEFSYNFIEPEDS